MTTSTEVETHRAPAPPHTWRPIGEVVAHAIAETELRHEYPELAGYSTGVSAIDEKLTQALQPGNLIAVAGETGRGKSAFLGQLAVAFGHQVPVRVDTLEDHPTDTIKRYMANVGHLDVGAIRQGFTETEIPEALYESARSLSDLPIDYGDLEHPTVEQLAISILRWAEHRNASAAGGVVLIDQLSQLTPSDPRRVGGWFAERNLPQPPALNAPTHEVYQWQCKMLRLVARKHNLLIVLACQLNDNRGANGRPSRESVKGARGITEEASALIVPFHPQTITIKDPEEGQPASRPAPPGYAELVCVKGRHVGEFVCEIGWDGPHQRFTNPHQQHLETTKPVPRSERSIEGMSKLRALMQRWDDTSPVATAEAEAAATRKRDAAEAAAATELAVHTAAADNDEI